MSLIIDPKCKFLNVITYFTYFTYTQRENTQIDHNFTLTFDGHFYAASGKFSFFKLIASN